jgi:hypothetical protein
LFHAGPVQTRVPGALTNEFGIMVRRRGSVAFVGRAGAGGRRSLPRLPAFHAAQTTGAPVLNGLDRLGNLNDLEGGFFVIGKLCPPPFRRGLVANCSRSARQDMQSGCWPDVRQAALRASERSGALLLWHPVLFSASAHPISIECVSQENADAQKDEQRRGCLNHRLAHSLVEPAIAALRNWRQIASRMRVNMIEPAAA